MKLEQRPVGNQGLVVSAQGLGCMGMTSFYGASAIGKSDEYMTVFKACIDNGVTLLDTAYIYGGEVHNETIVGEGIAKFGRDAFKIATKFGIDFNPASNCGKPMDSSPPAIRRQLAESLKRLGTDYIDLYYQHRSDPSTPAATLADTLNELKREGVIRYGTYVGLSECTPAELTAVHALCPVSAVQMEWSLQTRDVEAALVPACRELGVGIVAYSPLGRGFLSSTFTKRDDLASDDWRLTQPRFSEERFDANAAKAAALKAAAEHKGCTPAQLALAWVHHQGVDVFPIPGTKSAARVAENAGACSFALSGEECAALEAAVPEAEGDRYMGMGGTFNSRMNL